jgi:hypothetical protein
MIWYQQRASGITPHAAFPGSASAVVRDIFTGAYVTDIFLRIMESTVGNERYLAV